VDKRPVKIEICSGSGEWAAAQAVAEAGKARWVAMELRHDRVYDCFSRMLTGGLKNLAVIGGDAGQILPSYVADGSVAHICVNFPEPPQRTGAGAETAENHVSHQQCCRIHQSSGA
jgi:tRNA G46 methylase TrmB